MEIDKTKLINNLNRIFERNENDKNIVRLWSPSDTINMEEILDFLSEKLIDPNFTHKIGTNFGDILLLVVTKSFSFDASDTLLHQKRCIALSKLLKLSPDIQRFSLTYFAKVPSPFDLTAASPKKKHAKTGTTSISNLDIVECCFRFLKSDVNYYKNAWKWSKFIELYCTHVEYNSNHLYKLICNNILALLTNMTTSQLTFLNRDIPMDLIIEFNTNARHFQTNQLCYDPTLANDMVLTDNPIEKNEKLFWNFSNEILTNVEGVMLPIFDRRNYLFFKNTNHDNQFDKLVMVESAKVNLRSLSLGVAAGKAVCLSGPVGCGKTTLVEYLACKTGRIPPKFVDIDKMAKIDRNGSKENTNQNGIGEVGKKSNSQKKNKRKRNDIVVDADQLNDKNVYDKNPSNGFLRIQLGDQTDSKMLLGQYRCTDVPGEFVWQPGVLTQAVMNGYWLLLEDLDSCTQDVCTVLTNLLENNYLSVPGFRDCLQISSGFQLFITLRTNKAGPNQNSYFQLLEKYLYTINILPLSRNELCEIICHKYSKLSTISGRIVDVFLTFSSGCHLSDTDDAIRSNDFKDALTVSNPCDKIDPTDEASLTEAEYNFKAARNSGRLVSTRDLLKLCSRSSPTFSITSAECAYFVFQNAVDLFCSHLAQGDAKTNLITSIGAKLGIIQSRCEYLSKEYKPDVSMGGTKEIKIGRVELVRRTNDPIEGDQLLKRQSIEDIDLSSVQKRLKLDSSSHLNIYQQMKRKVPNFSFTRLASCILERISVAVEQNEPVLLVGETGVGKTSSVQYLSYQTNHKLIVINMNNQSDVSDLVGGFKPVDLSFVMAPLRSEFEYLFKQTFNANKNEKFLNNISVCHNQGDFSVLIRLMLKIVDTVFHRKDSDDEKTQKSERVLDRWCSLKIKLLKLNSQLKNSINISFAFITGSLVNCIKNGDWVLLDEINLASTETLECLSTILEPNGSIVLLEKGDFVPVKRHPDFRIFACMNPSTDIGKKDLPVGIRNRFTEFFVDELIAESDLLILVGDYLNNTGIQKTKVLAIVQLYRKLRAMAQLELNDGLGNRPVYSLRTLCRALSICAKNLCGSIERNLYESFCLSFLTQLDPGSHLLVLDLIQKSLLSNKKAILSQKIPKPDGDQIDFEGYWIQKGPKDIQACENYILTESVKENLRDLARIVSIGKLPVLLQGPTSAGKTSLIEYVAKRSGNYCLRINNHEHTDLQEYIGTYTADVTGKLSFKQGVLVQAMKNGFWIILDELNLAPSDILEALNRVLDDNRELFIPETQELIRAHPNFMLFATQNPPGLYGGRKTLSRAFKNRFIELHFSEIPKPELEIILEKRCLIPKSYAQKMVRTMSELQVNRKSTAKGSFTLRDLFRWGNRYTFADKKLLENNLYDWNQHLVDEGYLVLSSKIRNEYEVDIIEQTLFNNFRKKINVENLFSLHENTSMVTKDLLQQIANHPNYQNIVWTLNMRRMAILTGKALEFHEPVLLVGQTGCGKTTICQILADIALKNLRILNCHMHTEGADFLGGLRPFRGEQCDADSGGTRQLFEWANGPLILSMTEGTFFLADEISLAEDSVLERLNCVLEPERTILLAERGGCNENFINDANLNQSGEFVIKALSGFQFLATMNPGGDFGKKELSPALRNRFTEVWCRSIDAKDDLIKIAEHSLKTGYGVLNQHNTDVIVADIATIVVNAVLFIKQNIEKFNYSIRDILAWVQYITKNSDLKTGKSQLSIHDTIIFGLETMFLDSLEMLPHESYAEIEAQRSIIIKYVIGEIREKLQKALKIEELEAKKGTQIDVKSESFGIYPFYIAANPNREQNKSDFKFTAPTTQKNLFRLLSALSLNKSVLLEGPPGVGKTSLIENLASAIGYEIVRINLCEHTDLADLFGTDQPSDDNCLELGNATKNADAPALGSFVWRDGPLLAALKAPNTWILLDELNLAPQSVLEGLNAILDHRGEVYIPELNKKFKLGLQTRIFASQNPLRQGGGRKGLPQSFLNRFTKVYLRKLDAVDLCHVINSKYEKYFEELKTYLLPTGRQAITCTDTPSYFEVIKNTDNAAIETNIKFDCCERMVQFSEKLDNGINNLEFGYKGGPYEVNLRDILRWCDLLSSLKSGFVLHTSDANTSERYAEFLLILYEKMKLVYCQRMRTDIDKAYIRNVFGEIFCCDADLLEERSRDIGMYWSNKYIYLNNIRIEKQLPKENEDENVPQSLVRRTKQSVPLVLATQRETLKALAECVIMEMPVILCGPTDSGKTKLVDIICTLTNRYCNVDTVDDSVTGSFQQIDLNRHLEEISQCIEAILVQHLQNIILNNWSSVLSNKNSDFIHLSQAWETYKSLNSQSNGFASQSAMSEELTIFKQRLNSLKNILSKLETTIDHEQSEPIKSKLNSLEFIVRNAETLNTGGHFEWVDSKIVRALKIGQYICLEHVNLCSSAILDRLNSVFEPNGKLLLSEKGVSAAANNQSECVTKHKQFRAFLTLDPKNGEISRAMRNRCVELNFDKDSYSIDDLKELIYENGIREMHRIEWILRIHNRVQQLTEFHNFNVSHLNKFAFLVAENIRLGSDDRKAIYVSALEVYVRSSHTDLIGFGLTHYRNKLLEEIVDELKQVPIEQRALFNFENVLIRADNLTNLALVRLQSEPLLTSINCIRLNLDQDKITDIFNSLRSQFAQFEFTINAEITKYLLYIIYELSSHNDIELRKKYIQKVLGELSENVFTKETDKITVDLKVSKTHQLGNSLIQSDGEIVEYKINSSNASVSYEHQTNSSTACKELSVNDLIQFNERFYSVVERALDKIPKSLPWNRHIFPRIRDYSENSLSTSEQLKLSAILLANLSINNVNVSNSTKLSQVDAVTYSKAVVSKIIPDSLDIDLIKYLYPFLDSLKSYSVAILNNCTDLTYEQYVTVNCAFLWADRLYQVATNQLFHQKSLDDTIIDKLTLHFNWLSKYLFTCLNEINTSANADKTTELITFEKCHKKLLNYITQNYHPLNQIRKKFVKTLTNFAPFYDENQIVLYTQSKLHENETNLLAKLGQFEQDEIVRRLRIVMSDESQIFKKYLFDLSHNDALKWLNDLRFDESNTISEDLLEQFKRLQPLDESSWDALQTNELDEESNKFLTFCKSIEDITPTTDLTSFKLVVATLPILEYYALKALTPISSSQSRNFNINLEYFLNIRSLGIDQLNLLKIISSANYKICESIWIEVQSSIANATENNESVLSSLPNGFYKNYSSFVRELFTKLRSFALNATITNQEICYELDNDATKNKLQSVKSTTQAVNGALLTASTLSILFEANGRLKSTGLGDLDIWQSTLTSLSKLVWNNIEIVQNSFNFEQTNVHESLMYGQKLLTEIQLVQSKANKTTENVQFLDQFDNLIAELDAEVSKLADPNDLGSTAHLNYLQFYRSSLVNSIIGAIELNLLTFMPLLDPVEKNRLKKVYIEDDQLHLSRIILAYEFMKAIMSYNGLGETVLSKFRTKQEDLKVRHDKYSKKCALRPKQCIYSKLAKDMIHFLGTCCHPKALLNLIIAIKRAFNKFNSEEQLERDDVQTTTEIIKRIDLWINNAERFEHHSLAKYSTFYRDFTSPIVSSISALKYGLTGLKQCLVKERDSVVLRSGSGLQRMNEDEVISDVLINLIKYPSVNGLEILEDEIRNGRTIGVCDVLEKLNYKDQSYFLLMKTKLQEIQNTLIVTGGVDEIVFKKFDATLNVFNQIWKKQEEMKRQRAIEEESLYVNKTRCATEDDEDVINQEIENIFPNYVDDDFGEFIQNATLEQVHKKKTNETKSESDILCDDDLKFICETFIDIMVKYSRVEYYHPKSGHPPCGEHKKNLITSYQTKLNVFHQLVQKYKTSLNSSVDDAFYNGIGFLIGIVQDNYQLLELNDGVSVAASYNFYKDSNIPEIHKTTALLTKIETRVLVELEQWPDHAVLNDIIRIIARIRSLPSTAPVVRFSTGFQILRQKVDEWNSVAHKLNHLRELEIEIAEYVQRWTKLELQCWRECLATTYEKIKSKAYRYWFFIYNLLHEYLNSVESTIPCDLTDFKSVEKCFGNSEIDVGASENVQTKPKLKSAEVVSVLKQFIESSNYGEFDLRMRTLKSFEFYLHYITVGSTKRRDALISIIHNLHTYYSQFTAEIEAGIKSMRTPIEKKLKEFVKIESYNKDLSYFSMKNNIARVHRHLHKFLREFETLLMGKIASVFVWRANQPVSLTGEQNEKGKYLRYEPKVTYYMIDVKNFIAAQRLKEKYAFSDVDSNNLGDMKLLSKIDKLFVTSRNIVKQAVLHSSFPGLVYNLDTMLTDHIETCDYLRKLEVDRSQERPKQKVQAKHILTQKRKALADCYKTLTTLGLSYRSGLLETSLTSDLVDLRIAPFCMDTMIATAQKHKKIDQNLVYLNENVNLNYTKCVFKLKLLQTIMLTPNPELGLPNLDRIKGFAVDMFLLVQSQKQTLSKSIKELHQLQQNMNAVNELHETLIRKEQNVSQFESLHQTYLSIAQSLSHIQNVFEQYELLLNCVPSDEDQQYSVISSSNISALTKSSDKYKQIKTLCASIMQRCKNLLAEAKKYNTVIFHNKTTIGTLTTSYQTILSEIDALKSVLQLNSNGEVMVFGRSLIDLLKEITVDLNDVTVRSENKTVDENHSYENIDNELENIVHHILLSMQNIYKKYSIEKVNFYAHPEATDKKQDEISANDKVEPSAGNNENETTNEQNANEDDLTDEMIQPNHLKAKIHQEIQSDLVTLNLATILSKLSKIVTVIRHSSYAPDEAEKRLLCSRKLTSIMPILEQYDLLCKYYLIQQFGAHKVSTKLLNVMLTVFIELGAKGFCVPPDLMQDEDGDKKENEDGKDGEGFGLEDGTGENDVSDKIENEDQLDTAKKPGDDNKTDDKEDADCKEENGIDMSDDFDSKLQDVEKRGDDSDESDQSDKEEELDKQMGETEDGADKLDEQIWGSDDEKDEDEEEDENDMNDEEEGKGSKEEDDTHNNLDSKNDDTKQGESEEGLDAANNDDKEKKKKEKDIDKLNEPDVGEEQANPYHNELEEPPEPEDMDLGNINLDNEETNENDERNDENPFDIDTMKDNMEVDNDEPEDDDADANEEEDKDQNIVDNENDADSDSESDETGDLKKDETANGDDEQDQENVDETEPETQTPGEIEPDVNANENDDDNENDKKDDPKNLNQEFQESKDKPSEQENVQAMPENKQKGSTDQVQMENAEKQKQEDDMDVQDTGEDKDGVGKAENEESKSGHQGIADTKDTKNTDKRPDKKEMKEKHKQGATDEERTISETNKPEQKQLKTVDKTSDEPRNENDQADEREENDERPEADEYQHVKDAKKTDKSTMDNATDEQSKKVQNDENALDDETNDGETNDELMEEERTDDIEDEMDNVDALQSEKNENEKSKEKGSKSDRSKEVCETKEEGDVEGDIVETYNVARNDDTKAHCAMDIVQDTSAAQELTNSEVLDMRRMYENERSTNRLVNAQQEDFELWQTISNKMLPNARELCEQLRLILEPTKCTRLKGDYRTGRRINMKKIIPYIASQFRKDKIWLRRTKPAQRDYKITIAIDDSKSMDNNNSKTLTLQAISLVSQALTLLESGRLNIVSFGESPQIILKHTDQFDGPKLVKSLTFAQNQSRIAELLEFVRVASGEDGSGSSDNGIFENLLLVLSDGRNIYSETEKKVRNAIKLARMQRIFIVYIIIDNPENKHSILDIRTPHFTADRKTVTMKSYLDTFPFPYYVIVRDLSQLPLVLSDAMRQWFELVSSEQ